MGELRMHAIGVTEVRDMVGATPPLAATLRTIASDRFRVPVAEQQKKRSWLSRVGPFQRHDSSWTVVRPAGMPTPELWENLMAGQFIAPDQLEPAWRVMDAWIDALDWDTLSVDMADRDAESLDFALTMAGLPSRLGLASLVQGDLQIGLRPVTGMRVGYAKHAHVRAVAEELATVVDRVDGAAQASARQVLDFVSRFPELAERAQSAGRPVPDLVVIWWATDRTTPGGTA